MSILLGLVATLYYKSFSHDSQTGEKREFLIGRHDCEENLANYADYGVLCSEHRDECVKIEHDVIIENVLRAEVCFCSGPL